MEKKLVYEVLDDTLIIKKCPRILTKEMLCNINASDYKNIVLCDDIEEISDMAFYKFYNLRTIVLPDTLKVIGKGAFKDCCRLEKVNIPQGITELQDDTFSRCGLLTEIELSPSLIKIGDCCFEECEFENIVLPDSVTTIGVKAFYKCMDLKTITLPKDLSRVEKETFSFCCRMENINLPPNLNYIGEAAFESCLVLKSIEVPKGVKDLKKRIFYGCRDLKRVVLSSNVKSIGVSSFERCHSLEKVENLDNVIEILDSAFYECRKLREISLPLSLKELGPRVFACCVRLEKIEIPNNISKISDETFYGCLYLEKVDLPLNLTSIGDKAFYHCISLKKIEIPNEVKSIGQNVFVNCHSLETIGMPNFLEKIGENNFSDCSKLKEINIPEGVKKIRKGDFFRCTYLKKISLPSTTRKFDYDSFKYCSNLEQIILNTDKKAVEFNFKDDILFVPNKDDFLMVFNKSSNMVCFYNNGEYIEFNMSLFENNKVIKKMIEEKKVDYKCFARLYYWLGKRYLPGSVVINNMPLRDIDKFYINDNGHKWHELISSSRNITLEENKTSFFKLCYVLGLFDVNASNRDKAYAFIMNKIVRVMDGYTIHNKYDGFYINKGFNEEYAQFFMKYFNYHDFMIYTDEDNNEIDLVAASYNNFEYVKQVYPNKSVHTNRKSDILLPEHIINVVKDNYYSNVDNGNEKFATIVSKYGYSQEQFEKLQSFYNVGKSLKEEDMLLFISEDSKKEGIVYKLLGKQDPLGAVIGNITNCCQVVGGLGETCVEYGMTKPNSSFMIFNYNDKIIGQSWVWYDETSKTICLDNIEVPNNYSEEIRHNEEIGKQFIECLLRVGNNFKKEMKKRGLEVERVTIGRGFNDICNILDSKFPLIIDNKLGKYNGYSDAYKQYLIGKLKKGTSKIR